MKKLWEHWSQLEVKPTSIDIIEGGFVCVTFDDDAVEKAMLPEAEYAASLCSQGKFKEAEKILLKVTKKAPANSEAWRLLAQIHFQDKKTEQAVDELISALAADPKNKWALILMGNIYAKQKNDLQTAEKYFLAALKYYPDDMIAYNNLGGMYMEQEHFKEAIPIFEKVLEKQPEYLNAYYGLACCYQHLGDLMKTWEACHKGMLHGASRKENPGVRDELAKLYISSAGEYQKTFDGEKVWRGIIDELHEVDGVEITVEVDNNTDLSAHLSHALVNGRGKHRVKYNPKKPYLAHLIVHELTHLRMSQLASKAGKDKFIVSTKESNDYFQKRFGKFFDKAYKDFEPYKKKDALREIQGGLTLQLMNCPLDMFVEDYIYEHYPMLRPIQMLSMFAQEQENIQAANNKDFEKMFPREVIQANKVMNLCTSIHFKKLFGLDFVNYHRPTKQEMAQAVDLHEEYLAYNDYKPGEEYELIEYFVSSFNLEGILSFVTEDQVRKRNSLRDLAKSGDPLTIPTDEEQEAQSDLADEKNAEFRKLHPDGEDHAQTMMMQYYMLGAMQYLDTVDDLKVKMIAQEIMLTGTKGIHPDGKYSIPAIPDKEFGGWQFLAYEYVSVARAFPEILDQLGLPFKQAYNGAMFMYKMNKGKK